MNKLLSFLFTLFIFSSPASAGQPVNIYDAQGHPISATLNAGKYYLDVNASLLESATAAAGAAAPGVVKVVAGVDGGGLVRPLLTDTTGSLQIAVAAASNTSGSFVGSTVIGSGAVVTFNPPANAVGFVLEASSDNTVNLRYAIVTAPTTTSGMRLEPGRDTGYIPANAAVKVIAESSSNQEVQLTWVKSQ